MKETSAIAVLSGGLDSTVAMKLARKSSRIVLALTFDYGQRAAKKEIAAAQGSCQKWDIPHNVIELPWLAKITHTALVQKERKLPKFNATELGQSKDREQKSAIAVWVPNRNSVFLAIAAAHAEALAADAIVVGFNAEEAAAFPDNSIDFIKTLNQTLTFSTQNKVKIICPTAEMNKIDILKKAVELDIDLEKLWSCYEGGEKPCGVCESCARTKRGMQVITPHTPSHLKRGKQ